MVVLGCCWEPRRNSSWRTGRKTGEEGGWMKRKHLVMVLDTLEYLELEGAAWVVSAVVPFLEDGFLVLGEGRVAAFTTALFVASLDSCMSWNFMLQHCLLFFSCAGRALCGEPFSALPASVGKQLNSVGQPCVWMNARGLHAVGSECLKAPQKCRSGISAPLCKCCLTLLLFTVRWSGEICLKREVMWNGAQSDLEENNGFCCYTGCNLVWTSPCEIILLIPRRFCAVKHHLAVFPLCNHCKSSPGCSSLALVLPGVRGYIAEDKQSICSYFYFIFCSGLYFLAVLLSVRGDFGGLNVKILCGTVVLLGDILYPYLMSYQACAMLFLLSLKKRGMWSQWK